jgi:hypothetical protein
MPTIENLTALFSSGPNQQINLYTYAVRARSGLAALFERRVMARWKERLSRDTIARAIVSRDE